MKQKDFLNWILGGIALLLALIFIKYEMASNRRALSEDIKQALKEGPENTVQGAINKIGQSLTNAGATNVSLPARAQDAFGSLVSLATEVGNRAGQIISNGVSVTTNQKPQGSDILHNVLNLTTEAGRQVNDLALQATELSVDEEIELGNQIDKKVLTEMPEAKDPANASRLQVLSKELVEQCSRKQIKYHIRLVNSDVVNAFSMAGGYVYVTTAYMKKFSSDSELAMTLGHEIAHIDLKHAVHKAQYYYQGQKVFGDFAAIGQLCYAVLSSPYSKEQEYQADAWGFTACKKAGWETSKLLQTFETLENYEQEERNKDGAKPPSELERKVGEYFDSHPKTADRLERLKQIQN